MEWTQIIQAVLALIFVIGLLLLTIYLFKYCEQCGLKSRLVQGLKKNSRINIIESKRLDVKNLLYIIEADNKRYLILCGHAQNLLLNTETIAEGQPTND